MPGIQGRRDTEANESEYDDDDEVEFDNEVPAARNTSVFERWDERDVASVNAEKMSSRWHRQEEEEEEEGVRIHYTGRTAIRAARNRTRVRVRVRV
ncbi:uncharacterized protein CLUP02_10050 [Colletotrichum lupini]|uniref:Uncharacterized protein n=1 Tax=Colletotrichum lupini TaxID=145971 RepID=A0A9Q8SW40_9PEZI|nr:uncharacterized protein CLUP02_10050 [Colletotrichum lupini]UQC84553.1 hypothetical protein CLUP02_10050 [Colletotrichum lupini]